MQIFLRETGHFYHQDSPSQLSSQSFWSFSSWWPHQHRTIFPLRMSPLLVYAFMYISGPLLLYAFMYITVPLLVYAFMYTYQGHSWQIGKEMSHLLLFFFFSCISWQMIVEMSLKQRNIPSEHLKVQSGAYVSIKQEHVLLNTSSKGGLSVFWCLLMSWFESDTDWPAPAQHAVTGQKMATAPNAIFFLPNQNCGKFCCGECVRLWTKNPHNHPHHQHHPQNIPCSWKWHVFK